MNLTELLLLAAGVSMDAFAVAVCKGLSMKGINGKSVCTVGLYFGGFQAGMPVAGYLLGLKLQDQITAFHHWIAFGLLTVIGLKMIKDSREDSCQEVSSLSFKIMIMLSVATSIDALAVGVTFAFLDVAIIPAAVMIGIITFLFSVMGVIIGNTFGSRYKSKAELLGGIILIGMGIKIMIEYLGIFVFH